MPCSVATPQVGAQEPTESRVIPVRSSTRAKAMKKGDLVRAKTKVNPYVPEGSTGVILMEPIHLPLGVNGHPGVVYVHWFSRDDGTYARIERLEVINEEG